MTKEKYRKLVEYYFENDNRELNFQNRILIPYLEDLLGDEYDIVDVSSLYKNWEKRGVYRKDFAGNHTPDLLVVRNWKLFDNSQCYC